MNSEEINEDNSIGGAISIDSDDCDVSAMDVDEEEMIDDNEHHDTNNRQEEVIHELLDACEDEDEEDNRQNDNEFNKTPSYNDKHDMDVMEDEDYCIGALEISADDCGAPGRDDGVAFGGQKPAPTPSQWKEEPETALLVLMVAKAQRRLWARGMEEIKMIHHNLDDLVLSGTDNNILENHAWGKPFKAFKFLFGPESSLCELLCRELTGMTKKIYLQFIMTFFLSCQNQMNLALLEASPFINSSMLLDKNTYNRIWVEIGSFGGTRRQSPLWMSIETLVNKNLKALFLPGIVDESKMQLLMGLDDDKVYFNHQHSSVMMGLKATHHAKDNRKGMTLHTLAYSSMCCPVTVMFQ